MHPLKHITAGLAAGLSLLYPNADISAVRAIPEPIAFTQPDGSVISIRLHGDESGFTVTTTDHIPIVRNSYGIFEYADPKEPSKGSGMKASDTAARTEAEKNWISTSGILSASTHRITTTRTSPVQDRRKGDRPGPSKVKISNYPTIGRQKALVVLVEFADRQFSTMDDAWEYYNGLLNEPCFSYRNGANGSARDFYLDSSSGLFDPEFVVVGPVRLPGTVAFYGSDTTTELDPNAWQMIEDACNAIDSDVDFSEFDADDDGMVDSVYFFYAGFGEADSGKGDTIWPHNGLLKDNWGVELELDGKTINNYACSNEIRFNTSPQWMPVGIGTFVHEFGHVLGIADHYDTRNKSGRQGVEQWDTMAAASYNDNQNTPPAFSAFERSELGWMELTEADPVHEGIISIPALTADDPRALIIRTPNEEDDEYFIIERRIKKGWDSTLPAEGLLVWHIDMVDELWRNNEINIDPVHQHIDIVEADGTENATSYQGDVFPGSFKVTAFDFKTWEGEKLFSFDHVAQLPEETLIILGDTEYVPVTPELTASDIHGTSFNIEWAQDNNVLGYTLSILDPNGQPLEGFSESSIEGTPSITVTGLEPESEYTVELIAHAGSYRSKAATAVVRTGMLEFFESSPRNLKATPTEKGAYELTWDSLSGASDYEATLYRMEYGEPTEYSYGFDDGLEDMPEGWTTNASKLSKPMFGKKSPSLQMAKDGDWIEISYPGAEIESLSFYQQSQTISNILRLEAFDNQGESITEREIAVSTEGTVTDIALSQSERVRITFTRTGGYVVIDDIEVSVKQLEGIPCAPYVDVLTDGKPFMRIEGLDSDKEYGFTTTGVNGMEKSRPSEMLRFKPESVNTGVNTMSSIPNEKEDWFDLSGRKVSGSNLPAGVYIHRKGTSTSKTINK